MTVKTTRLHNINKRQQPVLHQYSQALTNAVRAGAWLTLIAFAAPVLAEDLGSVDTKFNLLSPDDSINVAFFDDPAVEGVTCYLSRAQKGGYRGALGLAEDTSDASIDCRQTGPIRFTDTFSKGDQVFRERRSLVFKSLKVVRFCDTTNNALVYLAYSDKVIEGSPKNSVSAVPLRPWVEAVNSSNTTEGTDNTTPQVNSQVNGSLTRDSAQPVPVTVQPAPACRYGK